MLISSYTEKSIFNKSARAFSLGYVLKAVNANPGLKVNLNIIFYCIKRFLLLMFCVVGGYSNSKQRAKQFKKKTSPQSYKLQLGEGGRWMGSLPWVFVLLRHSETY